MELRIRGLADEAHKALKFQALRDGVSLNDLVVRILTKSALGTKAGLTPAEMEKLRIFYGKGDFYGKRG